MRTCPQCASTYADSVDVCARDGQTLIGAAVASAAAAAGSLAAAVATAPAPSEGFDSLVGATLANRYQIVRRIGEGGMGAVYEAKHTIIGKRVAVKVLLEKFLTKSDFVARLLQEARLASAIGHEHIVDVTDFGTTDDGRAFVVMEFLEGEALSQLVMREAPLPVERALQIARQVASALGAAHAKGIVHRDVKPENIYLVKRGDADFIKVVDFGISKAVKQGQGEDGPDYRLTHTGLLLGTPLYMSPEQARGEEDLDQRVDVWSLGVLLYECLTGEVPFRANNYLGIISQVLTHEALSPAKLRPELGISEAVDAVVMHAMEKDRARRYQTMAALEADLERLLAGDHNVGPGTNPAPTTEPPATNQARGRLWVWGAAIAALIGGVAMALQRPGPVEPPVRVSAPTTISAPRVSPPTPVHTADDQAVSPRAAAEVEARPAPPRTGNHLTRERVDRHVTTRARGEQREPGAARAIEPPPRRTSEEVLRGALPSRSGEGYPDLP
jgi:serine/threonine-protein kinase